VSNTYRSPAGMIQLQARGSVDDAWKRLEGAVAARNLTVFARIDFAADAAAVGMTLLPTRLLVFGNPRAGPRSLPRHRPWPSTFRSGCWSGKPGTAQRSSASIALRSWRTVTACRSRCMPTCSRSS